MPENQDDARNAQAERIKLRSEVIEQLIAEGNIDDAQGMAAATNLQLAGIGHNERFEIVGGKLTTQPPTSAPAQSVVPHRMISNGGNLMFSFSPDADNAQIVNFMRNELDTPPGHYDISQTEQADGSAVRNVWTGLDEAKERVEAKMLDWGGRNIPPENWEGLSDAQKQQAQAHQQGSSVPSSQPQSAEAGHNPRASYDELRNISQHLFDKLPGTEVQIHLGGNLVVNILPEGNVDDVTRRLNGFVRDGVEVRAASADGVTSFTLAPHEMKAEFRAEAALKPLGVKMESFERKGQVMHGLRIPVDVSAAQISEALGLDREIKYVNMTGETGTLILNGDEVSGLPERMAAQAGGQPKGMRSTMRPRGGEAGFVDGRVVSDAVDVGKKAVDSMTSSRALSGGNALAGAIEAVGSAAKGDVGGTVVGGTQTALGTLADKLAANGKAGLATKANIAAGSIAAGYQGIRTYQETGDLGEAALATAKSGAVTGGFAVGASVAPSAVGTVVTYVGGTAAGTAAAAGTATAIAVGGSVIAAGAGGYAVGSVLEEKLGVSENTGGLLDAAANRAEMAGARFGKGADLLGYTNLNDIANEIRGDSDAFQVRDVSPAELRAKMAEMRDEAQNLDGGGFSGWVRTKLSGGEDFSEKGNALRKLDSAEKELSIYEKYYEKEKAAEKEQQARGQGSQANLEKANEQAKAVGAAGSFAATGAQTDGLDSPDTTAPQIAAARQAAIDNGRA